MAEISWIKLSVGMFDNRKIKQIKNLPDGDSIILIWLQLLCLAGRCNDYGRVYITEDMPYNDQMLATEFNEPIATVQLALATFQKFNMIDVYDDIICVLNWEKYQAIEGMEKVREQTRKRVANFREKQKQIALKEDVTLHNVTVTEQNKNKNKIKNKNNIFIPPTLEEVEEYVKSRGNKISAKAFYDYYTTGNWIDAKGQHVKNWKQKVITWENKRTVNNTPDFTSKQYDSEDKHMTQEEADAFYKEIYG